VRARTLNYGHAAQAAEDIGERREIILGRLVNHAAEPGLRIAYDLLGSRDQAEDAVQEALARACEACHRVREIDAAEGWFYRILTNICMRALRRRRLRLFVLGRVGLGRHGHDASESQSPPPGAASSPRDAERALARHREHASLMRALDRLPTKQRTALLLRYGHDLSINDLADMLGIKPATAKTHLVRGLRRLRQMMNHQAPRADSQQIASQPMERQS